MIKTTLRNIGLFTALLILTIAGSIYADKKGISATLEYIAYIILLLDIGVSFIFRRTQTKKSHTIIIFAVVSILFSIGLLVQEIVFIQKVVLIFTMMAISMSALLSENLINSFKNLKLASYAVFCGVIISFVLAIYDGGIDSTIIIVSEGIFNTSSGFSGGILFKNYFAGDMLIVFIGIYLYSKYVKSHFRYLVIMSVAIFCIIISNSRGAYALLIVFLFMMNYEKLQFIAKGQRKLLIVAVVLFGMVGFLYLYKNVALSSNTYIYRIRGWLNYVNSDSFDLYHALVGNASLLYGKKSSYTTEFRKLFGWDGSMELSLLDIMIKNGIVGLAGYIIIFIRTIRVATRSKRWKYKTACISITIMLLMSSLVETYIQSVHSPVGIYCYLSMCGLAGLSNRSSDKKLIIDKKLIRK